MAFYSIIDLARKEPLSGFVGRFASGVTMTSVSWTIVAGAELPEHAHPHEQVSHVLEGEFEMTIGSETRRLGPGTVAFVSPNVPHSGRAVTNCRIIDVFHPVRDDYR
jgi:quercetin dioxygenase-like cupin family protein